MRRMHWAAYAFQYESILIRQNLPDAVYYYACYVAQKINGRGIMATILSYKFEIDPVYCF